MLLDMCAERYMNASSSQLSVMNGDDIDEETTQSKDDERAADNRCPG